MKKIFSWNTIYGSVPGTEHAKTFLNNQDSMRIYEDNGIIIGIVADGCSAKNAKNGTSLKNFFIPTPMGNLLEYRLYFEFYYIDRQI